MFCMESYLFTSVMVVNEGARSGWQPAQEARRFILLVRKAPVLCVLYSLLRHTTDEEYSGT